jgi:carboxylate-amine ligase
MVKELLSGSRQKANERFATEGSFRFGIEEEFFLVDASTGKVAPETPAGLFEAANLATQGRVDREFLQSQVEATTPPFSRVGEAKAELRYNRGVLSRFAALHGLKLAAAGTHPLDQWQASKQTNSDRYSEVMAELQLVGRRNMVCGMHVHVEVPDPDRRVELMGRLIEFLPLFLALSTSSPFWQRRVSGLRGYRLAANSELPRSGLPEQFSSNDEYRRYVNLMVAAGAIKDASYLWWMVRPSLKYPTLELRAPDSCTYVDDTIAIASLYRCLVRHLYRTEGPPPNGMTRGLAAENKWQAQRHGIDAMFATPDGAKCVGAYLDEVIGRVREDAEAMECAFEVAHCRNILERGTSADIQLEIYRRSPGKRGLHAVADWLVAATIGSA